MDLPIDVTLTRPIQNGDAVLSVLHFDEPDLDAQIAYTELEATFADPPSDLDGVRVTRFWIARLAGIPETVAGKIKGSDLKACTAAMDAILKQANAGADGDAAGNETPAK
jgi:hypothetical protein